MPHIVLRPLLGVVVGVVVLPFAAGASVQPDPQSLVRIAYVKWVCGDRLSVIVAADVAGRHREVITRPERCRHFGEGEFGREDRSPRWAPDGKRITFTRDVRKQGVHIWRRGKRTRRID